MEIPAYQKFPFRDVVHLRSEILKLGLDIPLAEDLSPLTRNLSLEHKDLPNRFCVLPMEGYDGASDGSPGEWTFRRYMRYAEGGFGLIWMEATAVRQDGRSSPRQLFLQPDNVERFRRLVETVRETAMEYWGHEIGIVVQVTHAGPYSGPEGKPAPRTADMPSVTDGYLDRLKEDYLAVARLVSEVGMDGIDVKCCHGDLLSSVLAAAGRKGKYGGFEGGSRLVREIVETISAELPDLLVAVRLGVPGDGDRTRWVRFAERLGAAGAGMLGVTVETKPTGMQDGDALLREVSGILETSKTLAGAGLPVVGGGLSSLRQYLPHVCAAAIDSGVLAVAGMGKAALAYPDAPRDLIRTGKMDPAKCCMVCGACQRLAEDGGRAGCPVRDSAVYGPEYRYQRRFSADRLEEEAARCHDCEAAPCSAACPAGIDVPGFVKAFERGDIPASYEILRQSNVLPGICSHLCPGWMLCEGACVETTLSGRAIPILDLQYAVSWMAREEGLVGCNVPAGETGKRIAVVGAGPAGIACAVRLLEMGHRVVVFERGTRTGGTPECVIPSDRYPGGTSEIEAVLAPAIDAGRIDVRFGVTFGKDVTLSSLQEEYDATFLAAGATAEASIGSAEGVVDAYTFLQEVKAGDLKGVPARVALLAGGDCAMDAAATLDRLGATDIHVVYSGTRADLHWHAPESWFAEPGHHLLALHEPLGCATDENGTLRGLRMRRMNPTSLDETGRRKVEAVTGTGSVLEIDMVIEARGLGPAPELFAALEGVDLREDGLVRTAEDGSAMTSVDGVFAGGGLVNGGAAVVQCIAEGMRAAEEIDMWLAGKHGARGIP